MGSMQSGGVQISLQRHILTMAVSTSSGPIIPLQRESTISKRRERMSRGYLTMQRKLESGSSPEPVRTAMPRQMVVASPSGGQMVVWVP